MQRTVARALSRALGLSAVTALVALSLPALASAHQTISIDALPDGGGQLTITGDTRGDLITVDFNPDTGELVLTHDVLDPIPAGCHPVGDGPPYKEVRCPAAGIRKIKIDTDGGDDKVDLRGLVVLGGAAGADYLPPGL